MNKTKILSVIIVSQQGTREYNIGEKYADLLLNHIKDKSIEYPDSLVSIYMGFTADGEIVFEAINAPMVVQYGPV